jgi:hypothetical protein
MAFSRITNQWQMFWHFKEGNITWWKRSFKIRYLAFHLVERGPPHMIQEISLSYYQCDPQTSYHPHALWAPPVHLYAQIFTHYWHQLDKLQKSSLLQVFNEFLNYRSISMVCTKNVGWWTSQKDYIGTWIIQMDLEESGYEMILFLTSPSKMSPFYWEQYVTKLFRTAG